MAPLVVYSDSSKKILCYDGLDYKLTWRDTPDIYIVQPQLRISDLLVRLEIVKSRNAFKRKLKESAVLWAEALNSPCPLKFDFFIDPNREMFYECHLGKKWFELVVPANQYTFWKYWKIRIKQWLKSRPITR